jgi:heme/copper-type cytochrome/quinol oxidase subunit 2
MESMATPCYTTMTMSRTRTEKGHNSLWAAAPTATAVAIAATVVLVVLFIVHCVRCRRANATVRQTMLRNNID